MPSLSLSPSLCPLQYSDEENDDEEHRTFEDVSVEPVFSFVERLENGCSLARIREETRLQALEVTERTIANNTRHRFRVSEERIARFSVGEVVLFKDPENVPAKTKKDAKDPFQIRNVLGVVKERRALNFYQSSDGGRRMEIRKYLPCTRACFTNTLRKTKRRRIRQLVLFHIGTLQTK